MSYNKLTVNYIKKHASCLLVNSLFITANFDIFFNHIQIEKTEYVKYLGVYLDKKLTWKLQIDNVISKNLKSLLHDVQAEAVAYTEFFNGGFSDVNLDQWFSNLSEVSNPTGVMQAYIEPLIITRSGSRKF